MDRVAQPTADDVFLHPAHRPSNQRRSATLHADSSVCAQTALGRRHPSLEWRVDLMTLCIVTSCLAATALLNVAVAWWNYRIALRNLHNAERYAATFKEKQ